MLAPGLLGIGTPHKQESYDSIIPGIVPEPGMDKPVDPSAMAKGVPAHWKRWLNDRMYLDQMALCQFMDEQHKKLLADLQCMDPKSALGRCVSASWNSSRSHTRSETTLTDARSETTLTEHHMPDKACTRAATVCTEHIVQSIPIPTIESLEQSMTKEGDDLELDDTNDIAICVGKSCDVTASMRVCGPTSLLLSLTSSELAQKASTRCNNIEQLVEGPKFELLCVVVIFLNALCLALEQQYRGQNTGYDLGVGSYSTRSEELWPWAPSVFSALDKFFVALFMLELLLRLVSSRQRWFYSFWNYLDLFLVALAIASWVSPLMNPTFVRLVRFAKFARIIRVMRSNRLLESLKLLSASISASFNTLCLSLFVLLLIQSVAGMLLSQLVESYINDPSEPIEVRKQVFAYYGTFWRAIITMFEITFANWAPTCRLLIDNISESFGIFFLLHRCVVGFAMLSVIQAVFIQQTMKSAQSDEDFMVQQKAREKEVHANRLQSLFRKLDTSGDGVLSWPEFNSMLTDNNMRLFMNTLGVDAYDLELLFRMLEDGDGNINSDEFVEGMQRMKGPAQSLDMVNLLKIVGRIESKVVGGRSKSFISRVS